MFNPGDQVRCVDARGSARLLQQGRVYVVTASHGAFVYVAGVPELRPGFYARRFRRATDISNLTALLAERCAPSKTRQLEPA